MGAPNETGITMSVGPPGEPQAPSPPPERGSLASGEMRLWQKRVGRNKRREAERIAPGGAEQWASLSAPYDFFRISPLFFPRRWRAGLPLLGGGGPSSRLRYRAKRGIT